MSDEVITTSIDEPIVKELSAGIIITDGQNIIGCRPFARRDSRHNYDLPKGHWEEGEDIKDTAIRETVEETGFQIKWPESLVDLGRFDYIPTKDLHLFLYALDFLPELRDLKCTTYFELQGTQVPEVAGYKLIPVEDLSWFFRSLEPVIAKALANFESRVVE